MMLLPMAPPMMRPITAALSIRSMRRTQSARATTTQAANPTRSHRPSAQWEWKIPKATPGFQPLFNWKKGRTRTGARSIRSNGPSSQALTDWSSTTTSAARKKASQPLRLISGSRALAAMLGVPPGHGVGVAQGKVRIAGIASHLRQHAPGAGAFAALGAQGLDRHAPRVVEAESAGWPVARHQTGLAGAEDLGGVQPVEGRHQARIGDPNPRRSFERGADALFTPLDLQRAGDHA